MSLQFEVHRATAHRPELLLDGDARRYRRLPMMLSGRFMTSDRNEYPCVMHDASVGSASLLTDATVAEGERIIGYFDHLGGLEGAVSRTFDGGFALQFKISDYKREKLAAQIMWLINRETFPDELGRVHERRGAGGRRTTLKFDDGVTVDVELLDLSASGASIGTSARPAIGDDVTIGKIPAIVRRHHDKGVGVQFLTVLTDDALRVAFP